MQVSENTNTDYEFKFTNYPAALGALLLWIAVWQLISYNNYFWFIPTALYYIYDLCRA